MKYKAFILAVISLWLSQGIFNEHAAYATEGSVKPSVRIPATNRGGSAKHFGGNPPSVGSPEPTWDHNEKVNPLVDLQKVNPRIKIDIRYATPDNFMKEPLYPEARCLLRREAAEKLSRVQLYLEKKGLGLKVFDAYRPLSVQKKMWARFPLEGYIANPAKGSNHNRGAAVDLTLVDSNGRELPMPSAYDEFSERAHRDYAGGTADESENRRVLQEAMEKEGFVGLSTEWWHFDDKDAKMYPVLDLPFDSVNDYVNKSGKVVG